MDEHHSSPNRSRYALYKKGSKQVIEWLHQTANTLGRTASLDKLRTPDLLKLAERIRDTRPSITTPLNILYTLDDVIRLRQDSHASYAQLAREQTARGNDRLSAINATHHHFVKVLKKVRDTLRPRAAGEKPSPEVVDTSKTDMSNLFAYLELEEDTTPSNLQAVEHLDEPINLETADDDKPFMIWCFMQDIWDMRQQVHNIWRRYYSGELSFITASRLTETAFSLVQEFIKVQFNAGDDRRFCVFDNIMNLLELRLEMSEGELFRFSSGSDERANGPEAADFFCAPARCILIDVLRIGRGSREPDFVVSEKRHYNGHPFAAVVRSILPQLDLLSKEITYKHGPRSIGKYDFDEFTRNLILVYTEGIIPTSAIAQCQMYLDVFDALGSKLDTNRLLRDTVSRIQPALKGYHEVMKKPLQYNTSLNDDRGLLKTFEDIIYKNRFPSQAKPNMASKPSLLFAALPILAGDVLYKIKESLAYWSIESVDTSLVTVGIAYLYSAAPTKPEWPDMDYILGRFQPRLPASATIQAYNRSFALVIRNDSKIQAGKRTTRAEAAAPKLQHASHTRIQQDLSEKSRRGKKSFREAALRSAAHLEHVVDYQAHHKPTATGVELLSNLEHLLRQDEVVLNFDYLTFAIRCHKIIEKLVTGHTARLRSLYSNPAGYLPQDIVSSILKEAASPDFHMRPILQSVGDHFQAVVSEHPESLISQATRISSGHIPDADKPCNAWNWGFDRPGYLNGKKMFGPETPWACEKREYREKVTGICSRKHSLLSQEIQHFPKTEHLVRKTNLRDTRLR